MVSRLNYKLCVCRAHLLNVRYVLNVNFQGDTEKLQQWVIFGIYLKARLFFTLHQSFYRKYKSSYYLLITKRRFVMHRFQCVAAAAGPNKAEAALKLTLDNVTRVTFATEKSFYSSGSLKQNKKTLQIYMNHNGATFFNQNCEFCWKASSLQLFYKTCTHFFLMLISSFKAI